MASRASLPAASWRLAHVERTIYAALGKPGYQVVPLAYACNELDEMLAVDAASEPRRTSTDI